MERFNIFFFILYLNQTDKLNNHATGQLQCSYLGIQMFLINCVLHGFDPIFLILLLIEILYIHISKHRARINQLA